MFLRTPSWANDFLSSTPSSAASSSSSSHAAVADLVRSLTSRRLYREVTLSLRSGLRDAKGEFSFMRVKGLKKLAKFLAAVAKSEKMIELFQESQGEPDLQVVPVLFEHSLAPPKSSTVLPEDPISCEEPPQVTSPPTDLEVALALRVLEGCCLIDRASRIIASQHMAVKEVIELLTAGGVLEQSACLDALLALMLDTQINQKEFERNCGLRKIAELVKNAHVDEKMRLKCAEFLLILIGNILPSFNPEDGEDPLEPTTDGARQELLEYLGNECASILKEASQIDEPFSDTEKKQSSLHSFAKQLLESLDLSNW